MAMGQHHCHPVVPLWVNLGPTKPSPLSLCPFWWDSYAYGSFQGHYGGYMMHFPIAGVVISFINGNGAAPLPPSSAIVGQSGSNQAITIVIMPILVGFLCIWQLPRPLWWIHDALSHCRCCH